MTGSAANPAMAADSRNDPLLVPYLTADSDAARDSALAQLLERDASPIMRRVLMRYRSETSTIAREDAEDIASTVHLRLLRRLRSLLHFAGETLADLEGYVVTLTYNSVYDFLRRRFPERTRLKNRTRYLLAQDPRFDLWTSGGEVVCGLRQRGRGGRIAAIRFDAHASLPGSADAAAAVESLLRQSEGPVALDDLVSQLAQAWKISDVRTTTSDAVLQDLHAPESRDFESRESVAALWKEIRLLRAPQRVALLLNARDADGASGLVPLLVSGAATIDDVAEALEMTVDAVAAMWNELPLSDLTISSILGVTRQQVINLRKSARERLARRLRGNR